MKKFIFTTLLSVCALSFAHAQLFNDANHLYVDSVVVCDNLSKTQIYANVLQSFNDIKGANAKSKCNLDYCDKELGIINYKGKIFLCFAKCNMMYGFDIYADIMINVRCKDGKAKITVEVPSYTFHWTADNSEDNTIPIYACYPEYDKTVYKSDLVKMKKNCLLAAETLPTAMYLYLEALSTGCKKIEDDF